MAVYLWDASHYDGPLNTTILGKASGQGIVGFTHKLGEALGGIDPMAATALAAARDVGIPIIGGYSSKYIVDSIGNFRKKIRSCAEVANRLRTSRTVLASCASAWSNATLASA